MSSWPSGSNHMKTQNLIITLLVIAAIFAVVAAMEGQDRRLSDVHYCNMTHQFKQSNGEYGWPDFEEKAEELCNEDGSLKEAE